MTLLFGIGLVLAAALVRAAEPIGFNAAHACGARPGVLDVSFEDKGTGEVLPVWRLMAVNADGSNLQMLSRRVSRHAHQQRPGGIGRRLVRRDIASQR